MRLFISHPTYIFLDLFVYQTLRPQRKPIKFDQINKTSVLIKDETSFEILVLFNVYPNNKNRP